MQNRLISIISERRPLHRDLEIVRSLGLPNWCIAAGYVRNAVWDALHDREQATPLNDVDVLYYDPTDLSEAFEKRQEGLLRERFAGYNWSVKNQARMHLRNGEASPNPSVEEAMRRWPETATAVGITADDRGEYRIIAPHGLADLFGLKIRRSPSFGDRSYFLSRIRAKNWLALWPKLELVEEP